MPDSKLTALTEIEDLTSEDLVYLVDDPAGTPASKKISHSNLTKSLVNQVHQIYCIGDSLTLSDTNIYPTKLQTLLGSLWRTHNKGIGGNEPSLVAARFQRDVLDDPNAEYVVIWSGICEINSGGSAATAETSLQEMYTAAQAAGVKVVALTVSPFKTHTSWTADKQVQLDLLNDWITNTATGIDYLIDTYTLLEDPVTPDTLLPAYDSGDGEHLSTAGYEAVGTAVYSGVDWLLGGVGVVNPVNMGKQSVAYSISRQALKNGNFDVWLDGVSFNPVTGGANLYNANNWFDTANADGGTLPTLTRTRGALVVGDLSGSFYYSRITFDGAGASLGALSYFHQNQRITHGMRYLAGTFDKVTISFEARSSVINKKIGAYLVTNYGTGGSPTASEVVNGNHFDLTTNWKRYTLTISLQSLINTAGTPKVFGTNDDDFLELRIVDMWGTTLGVRVGDTGVAETFIESGNIDVARVQVCAGDKALPFMPKTYTEGLLECGYFNGILNNPTINYTDTTVSVNVKVNAYLSADQLNITDASFTKVLLNTELYDIGADFDTVNSKFVVPVTGYYLVQGCVEWTATVIDKVYRSYLYVDGAASPRVRNVQQASVASVLDCAFSQVLYLTAAQYLELYAYHSSGEATPDIEADGTFLSVHLLSI